MPTNAKFGVLIKTNQYAGNFERELCAHVTGCIGECGVGHEYVDEKIKKIFSNIIGNEADDAGCYRPVNGELGVNSNDVLIYFDSKPTLKQIELIKERSKTFVREDGFKIKGFELIAYKNSQSKIKI